MSDPAAITPWLSDDELALWVQNAPDKLSYQKRLAIWLTHVGAFHAVKVSDLLRVSKQAVWLWVGQYNRQGPQGLTRVGRGGRRWAFMSWDEEEALLSRLEERAMNGELMTAKAVLGDVAKVLGRKPSLDYVYRLLHRHQWRKLSPMPRHVKADINRQESFKKNSPKHSEHS
ncbi:MAG: winged helix-turn-helix domain-containing protein [Candidatus Magnetominusculus sp. LBB02]|nr:winged helix-turn-helix domain-containing protein [Candidatus Magnetominusculus sp. LBB02]MCG6552275.1 winged helix-turn-helix domain-containing protein [Candidatus Magnetominusculus sp. LBB02]